VPAKPSPADSTAAITIDFMLPPVKYDPGKPRVRQRGIVASG
jgi:hypothetical protein